MPQPAAYVRTGGVPVLRGIAKARADLAALVYADVIHDSLYRSGGITLLHATPATPAAQAPAASEATAISPLLDRAA